MQSSNPAYSGRGIQEAVPDRNQHLKNCQELLKLFFLTNLNFALEDIWRVDILDKGSVETKIFPKSLPKNVQLCV